MKATKDLFSTQAADYAAFRPLYPQALYDFLFSITANFDSAWDCGTGNGQVAVQLARRFRKVQATDISRQQMQHAPATGNIEYTEARAEQTAFPDASFDLITVGTALHWFDFAAFFEEVRRVARPGAVLAAWAYTTCRSDDATDTVIQDFYQNIVGAYWDSERRYVDEEYRTIPFPFEEIIAPPLRIEVRWTIGQITGYLSTWSSVQRYKDTTGENPVPLIAGRLKESWGAAAEKNFIFPLSVLAGRVGI